MKLIRRVSDVFAASLHDAVDRLEEPERMLRHAIREMESSLSEATSAAARAVASQKLLTNQYEHHTREADQWHERARQAVELGKDDLAREALARKAEHARLAAGLGPQVESAAENNRRLLHQVATMQDRLAGAKRRLVSLIARKRAADARRQIVSGSSTVEQHAAAWQRFERMEEKLFEYDAEADALFELHTQYDAELERDIAAAGEQVEVEAELAVLKQEQQRAASGGAGGGTGSE